MFRKEGEFDRAVLVRLACDYAELDNLGFPLADPLEALLGHMQRFGGDLRGPLTDLVLNAPSFEELEASAPHLFEEDYEPECRSDGGRRLWGHGLSGLLEAVLARDPHLAYSLASTSEAGLARVTSALYNLKSNPNDSFFIKSTVARYGKLMRREVKRIEGLSDEAALSAVAHLYAVEGEACMALLRQVGGRLRPDMEKTRLRIEQLIQRQDG